MCLTKCRSRNSSAGLLMQSSTIGHRALVIFPLAAMLTFCQIIRKLDLRKNINYKHCHCSHVTDMLMTFRQKSLSQALLKCMHVYCPSILTKLSTLFYIRQLLSA